MGTSSVFMGACLSCSPACAFTSSRCSFLGRGGELVADVVAWSVLRPKLAQMFVLEVGLFRPSGSSLSGCRTAFRVHDMVPGAGE